MKLTNMTKGVENAMNTVSSERYCRHLFGIFEDLITEHTNRESIINADKHRSLIKSFYPKDADEDAYEYLYEGTDTNVHIDWNATSNALKNVVSNKKSFIDSVKNNNN